MTFEHQRSDTGGLGLCKYHSICLHQSALLVLNALLNNVFPFNKAARLRQTFQWIKKTYPIYVTCIPWDFWPGSTSKPGHALLLRSHKHTHMYALTLKAPIKRSTCAICLFPAHEPCRWPIRVRIGSFCAIYVNIKHPCMGNTEHELETVLKVFRNTFSVVLSIPKKHIFFLCLCVISKCTPCATWDQITVSKLESIVHLSLGALRLCVRTCLHSVKVYCV